MLLKEAQEKSSVGIFMSTKERLDTLVDMLNHKNKDALGDKAKKITRDDVLNELINAYTAKVEREK